MRSVEYILVFKKDKNFRVAARENGNSFKQFAVYYMIYSLFDDVIYIYIFHPSSTRRKRTHGVHATSQLLTDITLE